MKEQGINGDIDDILDKVYDYRAKSEYRKECHYYMAYQAQRKNVIVGVCVTIFSTIVGTTIFSNLAKQVKQGDDAFTYIVGSLALLTAVGSSLQSFWGFSGETDKNKKAATAYEIIYNKIDYIFLNYKLFKGELPKDKTRDEILVPVKEVLTDFEKTSPIAPIISNKASRKFNYILEKNDQRKIQHKLRAGIQPE